MSATAVFPEPVQLRCELTLGQLLTRAHEDVDSDGAADCPVCAGTIVPHGAEALCEDCGSRLI